MTTVKNEHIVYAYAPLLEGDGCLLLVGITDVGWDFLKRESGNFLKVTPPDGRQEFTSVTQTWIVRGKDKQDIHAMLKTVADQKGIALTWAN